jgi:hypothetical protein
MITTAAAELPGCRCGYPRAGSATAGTLRSSISQAQRGGPRSEAASPHRSKAPRRAMLAAQTRCSPAGSPPTPAASGSQACERKPPRLLPRARRWRPGSSRRLAVLCEGKPVLPGPPCPRSSTTAPRGLPDARRRPSPVPDCRPWPPLPALRNRWWRCRASARPHPGWPPGETPAPPRPPPGRSGMRMPPAQPAPVPHPCRTGTNPATPKNRQTPGWSPAPNTPPPPHARRLLPIEARRR